MTASFLLRCQNLLRYFTPEMMHFQAWKKGLKSLYYCRSLSIQRAESSEASGETAKEEMLKAMAKAQEGSDYEECLSCQ
mgnify:CR=1 FL=1